MRRTIGAVIAAVALTGAGAALAGQGATNGYGNFIDLNVAASPPVAGTHRTPQGVGLTFDSFTGNRINGDRPDNNRSITVRFNKGFQDNGLKFPACAINAHGFSSCSKRTQIGTGTGEISIPGANGAPPIFVGAKLVVYNGKPYKSASPTVIFEGVLNGKVADELDFTAQRRSSGLVFSEIAFPAAGPAITKFNVSIPRKRVTNRVHGRRVTTYLFQAPDTCHGAWEFSQTNTFTNAAPLTATDSEPCVNR